MPGIGEELMIFVAALLAGAVLKTAYTALGCLREVIPHGRIAVEAEDLLYWIAASIFLFVQIYYTSNGSIRWYFLLGVVLGVLFISIFFRWIKKVHKKIYTQKIKKSKNFLASHKEKS